MKRFLVATTTFVALSNIVNASEHENDLEYEGEEHHDDHEDGHDLDWDE